MQDDLNTIIADYEAEIVTAKQTLLLEVRKAAAAHEAVEKALIDMADGAIGRREVIQFIRSEVVAVDIAYQGLSTAKAKLEKWKRVACAADQLIQDL